MTTRLNNLLQWDETISNLNSYTFYLRVWLRHMSHITTVKNRTQDTKVLCHNTSHGG